MNERKKFEEMRLQDQAKPSAVITADVALNLIAEIKAVIKMVPNDPREDKRLHIVDELEDPNHNRPLRGTIPKSRIPDRIVDRSVVFNTLSGRLQKRKIKEKMGSDKKEGDPGYNFTKKTATSLLPRKSPFPLFDGRENMMVGFMFDSDKVMFKGERGKEKYIWPHNASTADKWWVGEDVHDYGYRMQSPSMSLEDLKARIIEDEQNGNYHYDLALMSPKELKENIIELKSEEKGLRYRVIGIYDKEETDIIPWDKIPGGRFINEEEILKNNNKFLPAILKWTEEKGHTPKKRHNELLACLAKEALSAVFCAEDDLNLKLNALRTKYQVLQRLNIDLPVLIITRHSEPREYTIVEQLNDLASHLESKLESNKIHPKLIEKFPISLEELQIDLKLRLASNSKEIKQYFKLKNNKTIDENLIIDAIIAHKNDEKFLKQLYQQLCKKDFDYLRNYGHFTNHYAIIDNKRVSTSKAWSHIEKAFAACLINSVVHNKDSKDKYKSDDQVIKDVNLLCSQNQFIANTRKWRFHKDPSKISRLFSDKKPIKDSIEELDIIIKKLKP
jgi:hypothetical protein